MNIFRQLIFFFLGGGGGVRLYDKEKIRNRPDLVTFYDFIFEQIPHEKKHVFSAPQYCLPMCTCSTGSVFASVACGQQLLFM